MTENQSDQPERIDLLTLSDEDFRTFVAQASNSLQSVASIANQALTAGNQADDVVKGLETRIRKEYVPLKGFQAFVEHVNITFEKIQQEINELKGAPRRPSEILDAEEKIEN